MKIAVAIPVNNESERIGACLISLARQTRHADDIVLLLNNCTDASRTVIAGLSALPGRLHIIECSLPPPHANAGVARRLAMDHAAALGAELLLTTDADAILPEAWIATSLAAIGNGADAVCGRARIDPLDSLAIPRPLHEDDAREQAYLRLIDQITARIDPDPADPWPRHTEESGASIAITRQSYRRIGGVPDVKFSEDRAMIAALRRIDRAVRHDPDIVVIVSGRTEGRAWGGMAHTIKRRTIRQDEFADARAEPAHHAIRRIRLRRHFRDLRDSDATASHDLARNLAIDPSLVADALSLNYLGAGWNLLQQASPVLQRERVAFTDIARQTTLARRSAARLIAAGRAPDPSRPVDRAAHRLDPTTAMAAG